MKKKKRKEIKLKNEKISEVLDFCDYAKTEWLCLVNNLNEDMVAKVLSLYRVTEPKIRREEESQKHSYWYFYCQTNLCSSSVAEQR